MKLWVYVDFLNRLTLFNGICRLLLFGEEEKEKGPLHDEPFLLFLLDLNQGPSD